MNGSCRSHPLRGNAKSFSRPHPMFIGKCPRVRVGAAPLCRTAPGFGIRQQSGQKLITFDVTVCAILRITSQPRQSNALRGRYGIRRLTGLPRCLLGRQCSGCTRPFREYEMTPQFYLSGPDLHRLPSLLRTGRKQPGKKCQSIINPRQFSQHNSSNIRII